MAGEVQVPIPSKPATAYFVVRNSVGQYWYPAGSVFEAYNAAHWTSYAIALTQDGSSQGYAGTFPSGIATGVYRTIGYAQVGGSAAITDTLVGVDPAFQWSGSVVVSLDSRTKPADTQARVTLVDTLTTYTSNTPQTGDGYAVLTNATYGLSAILTWLTANVGLLGANLSATVTEIWASTSRTLTAFGFTVDTNANATELAIKAVTDALSPKLPANGIADETLVIAATNSILNAVANCLQASGYTVPPTVSQIAAALFVDGGTNKLKVNTDHSVNSSGNVTVGGYASGQDPATLLDSRFDAVDAAIAALDVGAGSGAHAVTITVNDGTSPIQNATVTLAINASRYTALTDASGVAVLTPNEEDGTYNVRIAAGGYQFTPADLVVLGDTSHTYSMTQIVITPSVPGLLTGSLVALTNGVPASGMRHTRKLLKVPASGTGYSFDKLEVVEFSGSDGLVEFTNHFPGATYEISREDGATISYVVPSTGDTFLIVDCISGY